MSFSQTGDNRGPQQHECREGELRRRALKAEHELDAALATIATLSSRLRDAKTSEDISRRRGGSLDFWFNEAQRLRAERRNLAAGPGAESDTTVEDLDVEDSPVVEIVVDLVEERICLILGQPQGQRRIWFNITQFRCAIDPQIDRVGVDSGSGGPGEHEPGLLKVTQDERHIHIRLVPQEDAAVSHDDEASVSGHKDPLSFGGDHATPTDGEVA